MKLPAVSYKECVFIGSSLKDLKGLPDEVREEFGHAIHEVQCGDEPLDAKALKRFGGRSVLEIVQDYHSDTYRAVYTVRFIEAVYVLHVFQKKAKRVLEPPNMKLTS